MDPWATYRQLMFYPGGIVDETCAAMVEVHARTGPDGHPVLVMACCPDWDDYEHDEGGLVWMTLDQIDVLGRQLVAFAGRQSAA